MRLKMDRTCCVVGCGNEACAGNGITFHTFPMDPERYQLWVNAIPQTQNLSKCPVVCSQHFRLEDFAVSLESYRLNETAVPSIFVDKNQLKIELTMEDIQDDSESTSKPPQKKRCTKEVGTQTVSWKNKVRIMRARAIQREKYLQKITASIRQLKRDVIDMIKARKNETLQ